MQGLIDFGKVTASTSRFDWLTALANTLANFARDITGSYLKFGAADEIPSETVGISVNGPSSRRRCTTTHR